MKDETASTSAANDALPAPTDITLAPGTPNSGIEPSLTAATITVPGVLALLDGTFADLADGVAAAEYAFWLGSGISRGRVDDLASLIRRILAHLNSRINEATPEFEQALTEAIDLAGLELEQRRAIDIRCSVDSWPNLDLLVRRLAERYSLFLDIRVMKQAPDYLLWEAGQAAQTFGQPRSPDVEHLCLAILILEGTAPELASGNWDGLLEAALTELGAASGVLNVCIRPEDLRRPRTRARLIKFHGCAISALSDPTEYRELLIATHSQITGWQSNSKHAAIRVEVEQLAVSKRTLMIGLSAQDANIQHIFGTAKSRMLWPWPCSPRAHVFAEDRLGALQKSILKCVYGEGYDRDPAGAEDSARFPAYGKQLLISLVLSVVCAKVRAYAALCLPAFSATDLNELSRGLKTLRDAAVATSDCCNTNFVRRLASVITKTLALLQDGNGEPGSAYRPIGAFPVPHIRSDPHLPTSGLKEAAVALGLLADGQAIGLWVVTPGDPSDSIDGAIHITLPANRRLRVFFVANGTATLRLHKDGVLDESSDDALLVHSSIRAPRSARSPKGPPGRIGRRRLRHVEMPVLVSTTSSLAELRTRFRQEACL